MRSEAASRSTRFEGDAMFGARGVGRVREGEPADGAQEDAEADRTRPGRDELYA